jgi:KUP system potassium uptake protein
LKSTGLKNFCESNPIKALGLVFGDIGTSPIYTLAVIFAYLRPTVFNILGVISLIIWTLIIIVSIQYVWFAMNISENNEGGTIILRDVLRKVVKSTREMAFITIISYIALSLLIGDSVITPAISILSAVEGITLIPAFKMTSTALIVFISVIIAIFLFWFQHKGTDKVAKTFGPIMFVWFITLGITGFISIYYNPVILKAINPYYAMVFIFHFNMNVRNIVGHGLISLFVLSDVILSATGGEALYADMGHIGRDPIRKAWYFVFGALVLSYIGQGSFMVNHLKSSNVFFQMIYEESHLLYIPFLFLSIIATVIASQAVISGIFSIIYQGITTRILPLLKVQYTSDKLQSQIYINVANWFLFICVVLIMVIFRTADNIAMAYGLAVSGTMTFTGIMISIYFYHERKFISFVSSIFIIFIDASFFTSNILFKTLKGGYVALLIAVVPFLIIIIYTKGQEKLYKAYKLTDIDKFLKKYNELYKSMPKIKGSALFFARDINKIPYYITTTLFENNIIYENNIIVSIHTKNTPYGIDSKFESNMSPGLKHFIIKAGYLEIVNIESILRNYNVDEKVIFYGIEEVISNNVIWKIFAIIKKLSPSFVRFYNLPPEKIHGILMRIEI